MGVLEEIVAMMYFYIAFACDRFVHLEDGGSMAFRYVAMLPHYYAVS
jgi:hypothetical protein